MKNSLIIAGFISLGVAAVSCGSKRDPGRAYMPDMTYSQAYETYTDAQERLNHSAVDSGSFKPQFSGRPVAGTIARGDLGHYPYANDSAGYANSAAVKSQVDPATVNMKEAERLYLINCGICHGAKLDGNGPLYNDGNGPYTAAPKNLLGDDMKKLPEGTMFHSITYGKGQMGSYASQLTSKQRWEVIAFIKAKQFPTGTVAPAAADSTKTAAPATAEPAKATATVAKN